MSKEKLKLAYISQYAFTEESRDQELDLFCNLQKRFSIHAFTQAKGVGKGFRSFEKKNIKVHAIDFTRRVPALYILDWIFKKILGPRKLATDILQLRRFLKQKKPDYIIVDGVFPWGLIMYFAAVGMPYNRNVIVTRHTADALNVPFDYYDRNRSPLIMRLSKLVYRRFIIRANSPLTAQWLMDSGTPGSNIYNITIPINGSFGFSITDKEPGRKMRFVSLSRIVPMKALDILISSFVRVAQLHPDAVLDIYGLSRNIPGIGDYETFLREKIVAYKLERNVFLKGPVAREKVPDVLSEYDFHIASSHGETLNLVVAEAASRGIPSIATKYTGISHWILKHHCGFVCPCTPEDLTDTILKAIDIEDSEYIMMQRNCRQLWENFTPEAVEKQIYSLLFQQS